MNGHGYGVLISAHPLLGELSAGALSALLRELRAQIGPLDSDVAVTMSSRARVAMPRRVMDAALATLERSHLVFRVDDQVIARAIGSSQELVTDLGLVELVTHWLIHLDNADRVAASSTTEEYDVAGYAEACITCRGLWGMRLLQLWSLPPFHPGCRCFAQPRFTASTKAVRA